jgi:RNA polymerase sigma-70 factor (ECF subfamily)
MNQQAGDNEDDTVRKLNEAIPNLFRPAGTCEADCRPKTRLALARPATLVYAAARRSRAPMSSLVHGRVVPFPIVSEEPAGDSCLPRPLTDEEAMAQLCGQDHSALALLFDRYSRLVFAIGLRVLHDPGEAEDLVQEVFTYLYRKAELFNAGRGSAKGWIVRTAFHRALDRRSYLARRFFYGGTDLSSVGDTLAGELDLERDTGAKLSRRQLQRAFSELKEKQRQTLELFFFEGLELTEIAAKLRQPLGNVRHYYYRGLDKLRKSLFVIPLQVCHGSPRNRT